MLAFGSLILEISWIVLIISNFVTVILMNLHLKTDGRSGLQGGQLNKMSSQNKTVREQEPWIWHLLFQSL